MKNPLLVLLLCVALLFTVTGCGTFRPTPLQPRVAETQTGTNLPRRGETAQRQPKARERKKKKRSKVKRPKQPRPQPREQEDVITRGGFR